MIIEAMFTGRKLLSNAPLVLNLNRLDVPPETKVAELELLVVGMLCKKYEDIHMLRVLFPVDAGQSRGVPCQSH